MILPFFEEIVKGLLNFLEILMFVIIDLSVENQNTDIGIPDKIYPFHQSMIGVYSFLKYEYTKGSNKKY